MGESIYRELIKDMTWSYSRLEAFDSCPYRWYLQYIHYPKLMKEDKFYAVYGLFMHELLESYYTAKMAKDEVMLAFLTQFPERTQGAGRPNPGTVRKYFQSGKEYIRNLKPLRFDMVSVEEKIDFHIGGMLFTGRIDYLGTEDGEYVIVDNKSRDLKPRSGRAKPTLKDKELDIMLRQLYIYAEAVRQKYGKLPKLLCFNCFKTGMLIEEPFREDAYHEALLWAEGKIREILDVDEFPPNIEFLDAGIFAVTVAIAAIGRVVVRMTSVDDINSLESEAGIIASLIHKPEFIFYSEHLLPNHFTNKENRCVYTAIGDLVRRGIMTIDSYNIIESLNASEATRKYADELTIEKLNEFMEMSDILARNSVEEYKMLVDNVMDAAFRRDTFQRLKECQALCYNRSEADIEQKIYSIIDDVMTEFSTANDVPAYSEVIDGCWEEIKSRQGCGYSGIQFKFSALNEYATIEPGELFIFAAEAKQGKSMMLLNCAVDLLKKDLAVLYLDSELNTRLFTARILAHLSGVEYKRLTAGNYNDEEAEKISQAMAWLKTRKFTHIYIPMFDQQTIYTAVKKVKHTMGLDVLIVDYFKGSGDGDAFDSYQELGRFVDMVKNKICGDMGICGVGAAQATNTGKVADSAKIGRNASTIAIIQDKTPEEVANDGAECGNKKLRVILNRNGMRTRRGEYIDLQFNGNLISYEQAKQHIPNVPY